MPAKTRLEVREHLPRFLRTVAAQLPKDKSEPLEFDDDDGSDESEIPF
jgi:hypothetical protein